MPYRIDIQSPPGDALDRLLQCGALDVEKVSNGLAAIIPDGVTPDSVASALGTVNIAVSSATARDNGSVWLLTPRAVQIGRVRIAPSAVDAPPDVLILTDSMAFGTGHHPTTVLCVEAIEEAVDCAVSDSILDVGTGSGVLALSALKLGVPRAMGLDIDANALKIAAENAQLNNFTERLQFMLGGPEVADGIWPLVVANVLAAPLIEMAPVLVRRVGHRGRLIVSGIPSALESEVFRAYQRLGMLLIRSETRSGWTMLVTQASW